MALNLYLPPSASSDSKSKVPVLFYLSGLTCTGDNCAEKGFFQAYASKHGIAVVYPDTSPRGTNIQGEDESWDFGSGAGFYVDATEESWKKNYNMYTYITEELPKTLFESFEVLDGERVSIMGHSMGGHGALTLVSFQVLLSGFISNPRGYTKATGQFLKNPGKYRSVSALAPMTNPINCPWGQKAFTGYFGAENKSKWAEHDATELLKKWKGPFEVLIDVGTEDNFYKKGELLPENFKNAAVEAKVEKGVNMRYQKVFLDPYSVSLFLPTLVFYE